MERSATDLLHAWRQGDDRALEALLPLLYDELRALAGYVFRGERPGHTLQPTALVHEAYLRLVHADVEWNDRAHFLAIASRTMRRILVDHAREHAAAKRGGGWIRTTLDEGIVFDGAPPAEILDLDRALVQLGEHDGRAARAAELHYFGGLTHPETAAVLDISAATVDRDLRFARAWLRRALGPENDGGNGPAPGEVTS